LPYGHRFARFGQLALGLSAHLVLDPVDDAFRLGFLPVDEQPAWTLRYMPAYQHDAQAQEAAQAEGQPPAEVGRQQILVEKQHGDQAAERRTDPVAAVDGQIRLPAVAGRNQLVDGRRTGERCVWRGRDW